MQSWATIVTMTTDSVLSTEENRALDRIRAKYYMQPVIEELDKRSYDDAMDNLASIITGCRIKVAELIEDRINAGFITNSSQASKSIVGEMFSSSIVYLFLKAKEAGAVRSNITVTSRLGTVKNWTVITVGGEEQKPDMDLVFYSTDEQGTINEPVLIMSLKTSLRERAGQTYRWKLLLEIATSENPIKEKYNIAYAHTTMPLVCFTTLDFYDELGQPQNKGMLKFFDKVFLGKQTTRVIENTVPLSFVVEYVNSNLA